MRRIGIAVLSFLLAFGGFSLSEVAEAAGFKIKTSAEYDQFSEEVGIEPFVFVETSTGAGTVRRATENDAADLDLFGVATSEASRVLEDPLNGSQVFAKGAALGIELEDWRTAQGSIKLNCKIDLEDDETKAKVGNKFKDLIGKGIYSLWATSQLGVNQFGGLEQLGNPGEDDHAFKASRKGNGSLSVKLDNTCPSSFTGQATKLLVFYQFDREAAPETLTPQPGVNGAFQLFRVLK